MNKWGPWVLIIGAILFVTVVAAVCGDMPVAVK